MTERARYEWTLAVAGLTAGAATAIVAWVLDLSLAGMAATPSGIIEIHRSNPSLFIIDLVAPLSLSLLGYTLGFRESTAGASDGTLLSAAVDTLFDVVMVTRIDGIIVAVGAGCEPLFGYTVDELVGQPFGILVPPSAETKTRNRKGGIGQPLGEEWLTEARRADGILVPVAIASATIQHDGVEHRAYLMRDQAADLRQLEHVANQVEALRTNQRSNSDEAMRRATQEKAGFLAVMSRQLQRPMNTILSEVGRVGTLAGDSRSDELDGAVQRIEQNAASVLNRLTAVLDLLKVEAGHVSVYLEQVPVQALLDEMVAIATKSAETRGTEVVCAKPTIEFFRGDPTMVRQILLNVLDNACRHTHEGSITVRCDEEDDGYARWLVVHVVDTGTGIEADRITVLRDVLDGYVQDSDGLGLNIAGTYARLMGGYILLDSKPGRGTHVQVYVPLYDTDRLAPARERVLRRNTPAPKLKG